MDRKTKKLAMTGMLCALAYAVTAVGRIPIVLFLKYDPKDIVIAIGGLIWGPPTSFTITAIVSFAEMITISENGILGLLMNFISSCCFACTASFVYKKKHTQFGAAAGLLCGWGCMVSVMLLWNYLIAPIYLGYSRQAVVKLLLPVFLPFNLIKGGLNAAITMLLYQPVGTALRRAHLLETKSALTKSHINVGILLASLLIVITCVLFTFFSRSSLGLV